jgi:hypothetical protein
LKPDEKPQNVVVLVFPGDSKLKQRLEAEFPKAQWTNINFNTFHYPTVSSGDVVPRLYRVFIPPDQISSDPEKIIYFVPSPENYWTRDFYWDYYALAHGTINYEDQVNSLRAAYPINTEIKTVSLNGNFQAPVDGIYEFSVNTRSTIDFSLDHKRIISLKPIDVPLTDQGKIYLFKGRHPIQCDIYFRDSNVIPDIQVHVPGSNQVLELDALTH